MFSKFGLSKDDVDILQSIVTIVAILIGGFWTYRLFWLRRQRYPRVDLSYEITHRHLTIDKTLLYIILNVKNTGEVLVRIYEGTLWVLHILPLPSEISEWLFEGKDLRVELQKLITDTGASLWQTEIPWPVIEEKESRWPPGYLEIEPGNTTQIRFEVVINREVRTVKVFSFLRNSVRRPLVVHVDSEGIMSWFRRHDKRPAGWTLSTLYDIPPVNLVTEKRNIAMEDLNE